MLTADQPKQTWTNSPQSILSAVRLVGCLVCCVPLRVSSSPAFKFTGQRNPAEVPSLLRTYAKSCPIDCIIVKGEASDPCRIPSHQIRAINYTPVPPCLSKGSLPLCWHLPALVRSASSRLMQDYTKYIVLVSVFQGDNRKHLVFWHIFYCGNSAFFLFFLFVHESKVSVMIADINSSEVKTISPSLGDCLIANLMEDKERV